MDYKTLLIYFIYCLIILGGCSYIVFGLGFSGWWFLLAILLLPTTSEEGQQK